MAGNLPLINDNLNFYVNYIKKKKDSVYSKKLVYRIRQIYKTHNYNAILVQDCLGGVLTT